MLKSFGDLMTLLHIFVGTLLAIACIADVRTRRIPNALTFSGAGLALIYHLLTGGWSAAATSLGGWLLGAALFFPMFALRGMGGGDVKLLAAVGAWVGPGNVVFVALATSVAGGLMALTVAIGHGYFKVAISNLWMLLMHWRVMGVRPLPAVTLHGAKGPKLAYALPITIGTMVTLWLH
jgi:prepilin peptidase CpaA